MDTQPGQAVAAPTLQQAVEQLYSVFGCYQAPDHLLDVCTACCMDAELELEMRRLPLRQLTRKHFYQYNDSAKSGMQPALEIKYLLPRMLDLLVQKFDLHHSVELFLQRLGSCEVGAFSDQEHAALDAFALAFFADGLQQHPFQAAHRFMGGDAFDILLMFEIGGFSLAPLLEYWLQDDSPSATLHYAYALYWHFGQAGSIGEPINNAFADDREQFQATLAAWLLNPQHRACFAEKILQINIDELMQSHPDGCWPWVTPKEIFEVVFDLIAG